jgi:carbonic anhydrase
MSFLFIVAGIAALTGVGFWLVERGRKRTRALQTLAEGLGWAFQPSPSLTVVPGPSRFELFTEGRRQGVRNHATGERGGRPVAVFDFSYVTGSGRSQAVWRQTVVHVQLPGANLPAFVLRPEHVFHKIGGMFGYQDIDVEGDPEFSRLYLVRGANEAAIRALLDADVRDFYHRHPRACTEAAGADLFFWRTNRYARPEDVERLVDEALDLATRIARRASSAPSAGG